LKDKLAGIETTGPPNRRWSAKSEASREILAQRSQPINATEKRAELRGKFDALESIGPEKRMIYAHVDEQSVASVVSDWTGIPSAAWCVTKSKPFSSFRKSSTTGSSASSHGLR